MLDKIKTRIEKEIRCYLRDLDTNYRFKTLSPVLFDHVRDLLMQSGKRIRPILFVAGYLGFAKKPAPRLYTSALSMELLHNFVLVHDDIIDRSDTRRGSPSVHNMLGKYLSKYRDVKCTGQDLAIILGDVLYALGIAAFLTIDEDAKRKELASKKVIDAAIYTGAGEFAELLSETIDIGAMTADDIYRIYDLKTGIYSFSTPLVAGAILAGAKEKDLDALFKCGIYLGRAFQIKDDLSDLVEAKKTIILLHAYRVSGKKERAAIKNILKKDTVHRLDLLKARKIIISSGAIEFAENEIKRFTNKAISFCIKAGMRQPYKDLLINYSNELAS